MNKPDKKRADQLKDQYVSLIDRHLQDLVHNKAEDMHEIEDFARQMFIHPIHLSNTIKAATGESACSIYQYKILAVAQQLLADPARSIRDISLTLTFEPSQFVKWFKRFTGLTPSQYRRLNRHPA
jgi:AraC-like DNA-binding protein